MRKLVDITKLHKKTFGVRPKETGNVKDPDQLYTLIKKAIEENTPYDESKQLSALDRELAKKKPILF